MYVSITGLKTKNIFSWFKFWFLAIPAFREAQKSKKVLFFVKQKKIKVITILSQFGIKK